jgi:hypothetical protein
MLYVEEVLMAPCCCLYAPDAVYCYNKSGSQHVMRSTDRHPAAAAAAAAAAAGFTAHPSAAVQAPGTYLGLIEKLDYLKALGVNAIELLPVSHECRTRECVLGSHVLPVAVVIPALAEVLHLHALHSMSQHLKFRYLNCLYCLLASGADGTTVSLP